jgi:hypothetical protein
VVTLACFVLVVGDLLLGGAQRTACHICTRTGLATPVASAAGLAHPPFSDVLLLTSIFFPYVDFLSGGMRRPRQLLFAELGAGALLALRLLLIGGSPGIAGGGGGPKESATQRRKSMV